MEVLPKFCACGCGQALIAKACHKYQREPVQFLHGHWRRKNNTRNLRRTEREKPPAEWIPPSGLCGCGCGLQTPIAKINRKERGQWIGYPIKFIHGHAVRVQAKQGAQSSNWKGGRAMSAEHRRRISEAMKAAWAKKRTYIF